MPTETLFTIFNTGVILPWLLLWVAPKWKGTQWMAKTQLPVLILAVAYLVFIIWAFTLPEETGIDFTNFDSIRAAFARPEVMLVGWVHYLAFDLAVGLWEFRDAQKRAMPHWLLVPCLIFTLMYGPVGYLLYMLARGRFTDSDRELAS